MNSPRESLDADEVSSKALKFLTRQRGWDSSSAEDGELAEWLAAAPAHRLRFEELQQLWQALDPLRTEPAMLAMREEALVAVARQRRGSWLKRALAACILGLAVLGGSWEVYDELRSKAGNLAPQIAARDYSSRIGQTLSVGLADGSLAVLDTDSAIRTRIGLSGKREITVLRGRVMFDVASHPDRPFDVSVGDDVVTAIGTRFDVARTATGMRVDLVEGRLKVRSRADVTDGSSALMMGAGDRITARDDIWVLARGAVKGEPDWVSGQLVFNDQPVVEVVGELQRYTSLTLTITDTEVAAHPISAVISTDDPMMFIEALNTMGVARIVKTGNAVELAAPR